MITPASGGQDHDHPDDQRPRHSARWLALRIVLAVGATGLSVYSLGRIADPHGTLALLGSAKEEALGLSVGLLVASLAAKSMRWRALLPSPNRVKAVEAYQIFHISILLNNILPFRLGDGMRILSPPIRRNVPARQAVFVLVAERLIDAVTLAALALLAAPAIGLPLALPAIPALDWRFGTLIAAGALALAITAALQRIGTLPGLRLAARAATLKADIWAVGSIAPGRLTRTVGWTVAAWLGTLWLHFLLFGAIGVEGSLALAIGVTVATNLSMLIPATPANLGIFHVAAAAPLLAAGISPDQAVAYAVLAHAVNTVPPIVIGAACAVAAGGPFLRGRAAAA